MEGSIPKQSFLLEYFSQNLNPQVPRQTEHHQPYHHPLAQYCIHWYHPGTVIALLSQSVQYEWRNVALKNYEQRKTGRTQIYFRYFHQRRKSLLSAKQYQIDLFFQVQTNP